ncbi:helix-turn-helix domain-containing protein [Lysobacter sp. A6]|uniref:Helix-turn-helix domain-containing protein n=1 Tax=Noviluteimonas lactosilytica TaxID=2888523 RepID=A0ABS8JLJ3_9GAMM|nr:helix-turn-helix domain-containing protein [Lysobacter lactosilyticus]MCC8364495.1 helix-turn-helix domain-containing protein [Lysobacter lactosilyticus]
MAANDRTRIVARHELLRTAIGDKRLSRADLRVLSAIEQHANHREDFAAWPSLERLMRMTKQGRRTVLRSIATLQNTCYVEIEKNGRSNVYVLNLESPGRVPVLAPIDANQVPTDDAKGAKGQHEQGAESGTPIKQLAQKQPVKRTPPVLTPEEQEAKRHQERESILTEYRTYRDSHPKHARLMERTWPWLREAA